MTTFRALPCWLKICLLTLPASLPSAQAQLTSGETYNLVARHSGHFLDAQGGGTSNGTRMIQSIPHGGSNQQWIVDSLGGGQYRLTGLASNKAVDVNGAQTGDNAAVILSTWHGGNNQRVTMVSRGQGYYSLLFVHSGKALTVQNGSTASGTYVVQATDTGSSSAQWKFVKGPQGYLYCGDENSSRTFTQKVDIAYGAGGKFHYVNNADGAWTFNNATFRDPIANVVKSAYYKVTNSNGPAGYTYCVAEGGSFTFTQPVFVAYGANGQYHYEQNVTGTVTFNNARFGDPAPQVPKSGWFKTVAPAPAPPPFGLSTANLNYFVNNRAYYNGGSAAAYTSEIRQFLELMGGDRFLTRLFGRHPNSTLYIGNQGSPAYSTGGNTYYNINHWNANPHRRVAILVHEFMHNGGAGTSLLPFYQAEQADPSKQWDGYAMTAYHEYTACSFQWIVEAGPEARQVIFDRHPRFYLHMVNSYIPAFQANTLPLD